MAWIKTLSVGDMTDRINEKGCWWDMIINYDKISEGWDTFRNKFNIDCPDLPHEHKAKKYNYVEYYQRMEYALNLNLVESVQNLFVEDIYTQRWEFGQKNQNDFQI